MFSSPRTHGPHAAATPPLSPWLCASLASSAFVVPIAMSASSSPALIHPRTFAWYASLRQLWFKSLNALIPVAWLGIESGLAYAAYQLLRAPPQPARYRALALLAGNIMAIGGWSRLFFGRKDLGASTVAAAAMVGTGAALVQQARKVDGSAARATVPFVAWVGFATVLTAAIWHLNRGRR